MLGRNSMIASAVAVLAFAGLTPNAARADVFTDLRVSINVGRPAPMVQRVWIEPIYETRCERVWVEPVFETRCERVWHEAVYEDRCERVWVPDRWETRTTTFRDPYGRLVQREERVLVVPGHFDEQRTRVLVRAGYFEEVPQRICISEGRWTEVTRQVTVREGYFAEQIIERPVPRGSQVRVDFERDRIDTGRDRHDGRQNADYRPSRDSGDDRRADARDEQIARAHDRDARERPSRDEREDRGRRY